jgi:formylglycine-generating enzyme required for sulfatase activity
MTVSGLIQCSQVTLSPFSIGKYEVSNARFQAFAATTGYKTEAEQFGNR